MKIHIQDGGHRFVLSFPTKLIFSKLVLRWVLKENAGISITPEAANRLTEEIRRIKKKYGTWELVEVHSADGESVKITL